MRSAVPVVIAAALIFSAFAKVADRRGVERAISQLVPKARLVPAVAISSAIGEWSIAVALLLWPSSPIVRGSTIFLFTVFAVFGVSALVSGRKIDCGCFGNLHKARLGWVQVCQLVIIAPISVLLFPRGPWSFTSGLVAIFLTHTAVSGVFALAVIPSWRKVRRQRRSLEFAGGAIRFADREGNVRR